MLTLVIATNNMGKRDDMRLLLSELSKLREFELLTMREAGYPEWDPEETGANFVENAKIKAQSAASLTNLPALADDSGLCVDALNGAPGLYSARWLGAEASAADKNEAILAKMLGITDEKRSARFVCALAFAAPNGEIEVREGDCPGRISVNPIGTEGFGYDPIFIPDGGDRTLAQMSLAEKNAISHRRAAWRELAPIMQSYLHNVL